MRVAVLHEDRCQPKKCQNECYNFCPPVRNGVEVITWRKDNKPIVSEPLCIGCGICVHKCPHDALTIVNLPDEQEKDTVHRYGMNEFRLFGLPAPEQGKVIGILGANGTGKTTAISLLAGEIIPNLGDWENEGLWDNVKDFYSGTEIKKHFDKLADGKISIALKPQYVDRIPQMFDGTLRELLERVASPDKVEEFATKINLTSLDKKLSKVSGGELQKGAIAATILKEADLYFFDEPSSYLDIHERMRIVRIIQKLSETKRVIVIEHDLAVLDVLADLVHIVYGQKGAFGIFTPARSTRTAINAYLDGFLVEENVRIRDKPIRFLKHHERSVETGSVVVQWGDLGKKLGSFELSTGEGSVHRSEVVGVVGPNGTGKSTMIKILAGEHEYDSGWVTANATISYKPQHIDADMDCTVQMWLDSELGMRWRSGEFNVNVIRALGVDSLLPKRVKKLSGGERQAVAIALCLGRDADLYLLDEPSAHLDANARMEAAKAIRRTMEANEKSAFVIDHDVYFIDIVSDSLLVFEGEGGVKGKAMGPYSLRDGMNRFLNDVNVTFRRDHDSKRPRINKSESRKDREQREIGDYYSFNVR